jgi:hypothetical protein
VEFDGIFGLGPKAKFVPKPWRFYDYYCKYYCCNTYNNNHIVVVKLFNYLGNIISCENGLDIDNKLHNYLKTTSILNNVFRPQNTLKKTTIELYNTLALIWHVIWQRNWDC